MVALIGLMKQVTEIPNLWKISAADTSVFVVSLLAVILLDVDIGLAAAVGWSLLTVVFRTQVPDVPVLGRALGTDIYKRADVYKSAAEVDGCKVIRFDAPLYFANADYFANRVRSLAKLHLKSDSAHHRSRHHHNSEFHDDSHRRILSAELVYYPEKDNKPSMVDVATWTADYFEQPVKYVIIDCSSICFVDINGIKVVKEFAAECHELGMKLFLAACKANMREFLSLCGLTEDLNGSNLFVTVHDAVRQAMNEMQEADPRHLPIVVEDASEFKGRVEPQFLSQPVLTVMDENDEPLGMVVSTLAVRDAGNERERRLSTVSLTSATQTSMKKPPATFEKWIKNSTFGKK
ncbi:hypothetical protein RvY_19266 [Ramazzottius varieornatus]|uniref:STAS domain-containing protein n=1 Tax=Ramazzottius varieornatus TaxID=947166 RepID=A0A1D1W8U9_RAMVA|nr:hypothetical protein RvY_19266 [Ramazzottius varieornatus]